MSPNQASGRKRNIGDLLQVFREIVSLVEKYGEKAKEFTLEAIHKLQLRFHEKSIAVIGPKASGKTTLIEILRNPNYKVDVGEYAATGAIKPLTTAEVCFKPNIKGGRSDKEIRFKLRKPKDVGGEKVYREQYWPEVCEKAEFFLIAARNLKKNPPLALDYYRRVYLMTGEKQLLKEVEEILKTPGYRDICSSCVALETSWMKVSNPFSIRRTRVTPSLARSHSVPD